MYKHIFLVSTMAVFALCASARQLTGDEALQRVLEAWPATTAHRAPAKSSLTTHQLLGAYVFSQAGRGFVVAPADDTLPAILAYTDCGTYDEAQLPPAFHAWLDEIVKYGAAETAPSAAKATTNDDFLLGDIAWTQDTPTTGTEATFTATIKNLCDYEYFAPLYLMVYDADGESLVGYSDYQLYLVPAHGEATVEIPYVLPAKKGSYHFCVAYETLGYNYAYSPMLRTGQTEAYDYVFNVNDDDNDDGNFDGTVQDYVMECVDYGADAVRRDVKVRFEGQEVYIQGISEEVPDGWAHATLKDGVAVFETPLLLGEWNYYGSMRKQYITGADTGTGDVSGLEMLYDSDTHSFTTFSNNWILLTGDPTQVGYYYDHLYNSVSLIPANEAGDSPTVTPPDGLASSVYQLSGRTTGPRPFHGILVKQGKKIVR